MTMMSSSRVRCQAFLLFLATVSLLASQAYSSDQTDGISSLNEETVGTIPSNNIFDRATKFVVQGDVRTDEDEGFVKVSYLATWETSQQQFSANCETTTARLVLFCSREGLVFRGSAILKRAAKAFPDLPSAGVVRPVPECETYPSNTGGSYIACQVQIIDSRNRLVLQASAIEFDCVGRSAADLKASSIAHPVNAVCPDARIGNRVMQTMQIEYYDTTFGRIGYQEDDICDSGFEYYATRHGHYVCGISCLAVGAEQCTVQPLMVSQRTPIPSGAIVPSTAPPLFPTPNPTPSPPGNPRCVNDSNWRLVTRKFKIRRCRWVKPSQKKCARIGRFKCERLRKSRCNKIDQNSVPASTACPKQCNVECFT